MCLERMSLTERISEMGKAIRVVRQASGLSMGDIARRFETSVTTVSVVEHGDGSLKQTRLFLMGVIKSAANSDGTWFREDAE